MRGARAAVTILQLPFEVLVGGILAILPPSDLVCMSRVCKALYGLYQSDYLWQQKFFKEFHYYRPNKTLRQQLGLGGTDGGWRRIYHAMDRVEVYTWGANIDCRLGYGRTSRKIYESVPKRIRRLDGIGIVQLAPTGWGCHALDKHGNIWAWGRIMESNLVRVDAMPRMLKRPRNVIQLSAGRQVVLAKDTNGRIWQWCRENKAVEVTFGSRSDNVSTKDPVEQISAGWDICAALTQSGRIFTWRPPQSTEVRSQLRIHVEHSVSLMDQGYDEYEAAISDGDKFVQIATGSDYIVAVTLLEKVYIFRKLDSNHYHRSANSSNQPKVQQHPFPLAQQHHHHHHHHQQHRSEEYEDRILVETSADGSQQEHVIEIRGRIIGEGLYLPIFSEALTRTITATYEECDEWERRQRHRRHHPNHTSSSAPTTVVEACCSLSSSASRPTTLSASSESFAIHHSSGKVLWGKGDVQSDTLPIVIERLHSNVSQVAFGEHHQGLLTEDGQLHTWGSFSHGALGQGDLRYGCQVPTIVEGPLKNKIVIGIGMAGWQSACLAIDLSEEKEKAHGCFYDSQSRGHATGKGKGRELIDDGYHSLESTSNGSVSGSGSSSEGFDSSDGEEWTLGDNDSKHDNLAGGISADGSTSHATHHHMLHSLFNPRHGTASTHSRPTPVRKRSSSSVERYTDNYGNNRGYHSSNGGKEEVEWYMLAMTRLSPIITVYEPLRPTEANTDGRRFSVV
ncbi:hypothetical protein BGZ79_000963 [Entomortierella chlamydospora]|nr:hypothetical protein BGZ79_000963 [Entomortierella chlamydospora]